MLEPMLHSFGILLKSASHRLLRAKAQALEQRTDRRQAECHVPSLFNEIANDASGPERKRELQLQWVLRGNDISKCRQLTRAQLRLSARGLRCTQCIETTVAIHHHPFSDDFARNPDSSCDVRLPLPRQNLFDGAETDRLKRRPIERTQIFLLDNTILSRTSHHINCLIYKWEDVDFERGTLSIRRSLEQVRIVKARDAEGKVIAVDASVAEKTPKSGKSRLVVLPASAVELLRKMRRERASGGGRIPTGYVFPDPDDGGPWAPHRLTDRFRELVRKAGLVPPRVRATTRAGRLKKQGA